MSKAHAKAKALSVPMLSQVLTGHCARGLAPLYREIDVYIYVCEGVGEFWSMCSYVVVIIRYECVYVSLCVSLRLCVNQYACVCIGVGGQWFLIASFNTCSTRDVCSV